MSIQDVYDLSEKAYASLFESQGASDAAQARDLFAKVLILSSASYFEVRVCKIFQNFFELKHGSGSAVSTFAIKKGVNRQYHTFFEWKEIKTSSINSMLSLFGEKFKDGFRKLISEDTNLNSGILAFLELGSERNKAVHTDFMSYTTNLVASEVMEKHKSALYFIDKLEEFFQKWSD